MKLQHLEEEIKLLNEEQRSLYKNLYLDLLKMVYDEFYENEEEVIQTLNNLTLSTLPEMIDGVEKYIEVGLEFVEENPELKKYSREELLELADKLDEEDNVFDFIAKQVISQPFSFVFKIFMKYKEGLSTYNFNNYNIVTEKLGDFITEEIIEDFQDYICDNEYFLTQSKEQIEFFIRFLNITLNRKIENNEPVGLEYNNIIPRELFIYDEQYTDLCIERFYNFKYYFELEQVGLALKSK